MGDMGLVRGSVVGTPRTKKMLAGGTIEEGDLVTTTTGAAVKVADDGAAVSGLAMEAIANGAYGMVYMLDAGALVEGVDKDTCVAGDQVGVNVTSNVQTFEKGGSNKTFRVVKVTADDKLQCKILDSVIG